MEYDTVTVVQFHPSVEATVAALDGLAAGAASDILAVCVGQGCTKGVTENVARQRGWPFLLAYDAGGVLGGKPQATASRPRPSTRSGVASLRPSLPFSGSTPGSVNSGLTASMTTPDIPRLVSARGFLIIALPVMLLGLGGVAFYAGSRRRSDSRQADEDEDEQLERLVRARHGRKRPPVR